mgnify:FL=1
MSVNLTNIDERITREFGNQVTLQTVARVAGVSPSTVSRILNGTANVSQGKRKLVEEAIRRLGFRPNQIARSLAGGRTMTIGVLTQYIDSPFYGAGIRGIEEVLSGAGYIPIFTSGFWDIRQERKRLQSLMERRVDGLIILTSRLHDEELLKLASRLPVVVSGRGIKFPNLHSLNFDNAAAGRIAAEHLVDLGHRDLAVISGPHDHKDSDERLRGICLAVEAKNYAINDSLIVAGDYNEHGGYRAMRQIISRNLSFSAIIALNDQMAFGAMLALQQAGLRVPDDVSVVGIDDVTHSAFTIPPLTSVSLPMLSVGRRAAAILLDVFSGYSLGEKCEILEPTMTIRESTHRIVV